MGLLRGGADLPRAAQIGERFLHLASELRQPVALVAACYASGVTAFYRGDLALAERDLDRALAHYGVEQRQDHAVLYGQDLAIACHSYLSWVLALQGRPAAARAASQRALTIAAEADHAFSLTFAEVFAAQTWHFLREAERAAEAAERARALAAGHGFAQWEGQARLLLGRARERCGDARALEWMQDGLEAYRATGAALARPYAHAWLAEAWRDRGEHERALALLDEMLADGVRSGERYYDAELLRVKGEILWDRGDEAAALAALREAIALAGRQGAGTLQLRAETSLCRLLRDEARAPPRCARWPGPASASATATTRPICARRRGCCPDRRALNQSFRAFWRGHVNPRRRMAARESRSRHVNSPWQPSVWRGAMTRLLEEQAGTFVSGAAIGDSAEDYRKYVKYVTIPLERQQSTVFEYGDEDALRPLEDPLRRRIFDAASRGAAARVSRPRRAAERGHAARAGDRGDHGAQYRPARRRLLRPAGRSPSAHRRHVLRHRPAAVVARRQLLERARSAGSLEPELPAADGPARLAGAAGDQPRRSAANARVLLQISVLSGALAALGAPAFDQQHGAAGLQVGPWNPDVGSTSTRSRSLRRRCRATTSTSRTATTT